MIFLGETPQGTRRLLGAAREVTLSFDADAPADGLLARFSIEAAPPAFTKIFAQTGEETVFSGIVDEENTFLTEDGLTLEISGRSLEALLLDSEALPGTVQSPVPLTIARRFLEPLGLFLGEADAPPLRGALTVEKGQSVWSALTAYCSARGGGVPRVSPEGAVTFAEDPPRRAALTQVLSAAVRREPYRRVSTVWQQSARGSYDTLYQSVEPGVRRVRYLAMGSGVSPKALLLSGEAESFSLEVTCPGRVWPPRGLLVTVTLPRLGTFADCPVRAARYTVDGQGERTRLTLGPPAQNG